MAPNAFGRQKLFLEALEACLVCSDDRLRKVMQRISRVFVKHPRRLVYYLDASILSLALCKSRRREYVVNVFYKRVDSSCRKKIGRAGSKIRDPIRNKQIGIHEVQDVILISSLDL